MSNFVFGFFELNVTSSRKLYEAMADKESITRMQNLAFRLSNIASQHCMFIQLGPHVTQSMVFEVIRMKKGEHNENLLPFTLTDSPISDTSGSLIAPDSYGISIIEFNDKSEKCIGNILGFITDIFQSEALIHGATLFISEGFNCNYKHFDSENDFVREYLLQYCSHNIVPSISVKMTNASKSESFDLHLPKSEQ